MNVKIYANVIEQVAIEQIDELSKQKAFENQKIRIMPDVHAGKGCVIGFTSTMGDYIIPNVVGVDIGCGMLTVELGIVIIDFQNLDDVIKKYVPSGRNAHDTIISDYSIDKLICFDKLKNVEHIKRSLGTLGGGNHFIEIDADNTGNKYLVIHTGSRNLGKQVADYYQELAFETLSNKSNMVFEQNAAIKTLKATGKTNEIQNTLKEIKQKYDDNGTNIPKDLAYLTGADKDAYLHDMAICQEYAKLNREIIADIIMSKTGLFNEGSFETVHNYIDLDKNIIRKGAVSAQKGEKLLIPLNMRDGCIMAIGKGNDDWNCSSPHGAGRIMGRMQAKRTFNMDEYKNSMDGIYSTSICEETLDELPMAYKNMSDILNVIEDTVDIINIIKPIYNFKATE